MSKKTVIILLIVGAILLCMCSAGGVGIWYLATRPTPTPTVTATPTTTSKPTVTAKPTSAYATATPTKPAVRSTFTDVFSNNMNGWPTGDYDGDYSSGTEVVQNGVYSMDITAKESMFHSSYPEEINNFENFDVSVDVKVLSGPDDASIGLMIKRTTSEKYGFVISPGAGQYNFYYIDETDDTTLIDWEESDEIYSTGFNTIRIVSMNGLFTFYINGTLVDSITDTSNDSGEIGLLVELYDTDDQAIFQFDNLEVIEY